MEFVARVQRMNRITIPKETVKELNIKPWDLVRVNLTMEHRLK